MTMLLPGTVCVANGRVIQIDGPDSLTHMRARDTATGEMISVAISKIESLPIPTSTITAGAIPEAEWKRCVALARDLTPFNDRTRLARNELKKLAQCHGMSVRQLQRVRAAFMKDPKTSTLARRPGGRPLGLNRLDPRVDTLIRHVIDKHYLRREKPSKEYIVLRAQSMARRLGLPLPSRNAVLRRLNREIGRVTDFAREGSRKARQKWDVRTGGLSVASPLELIQIDHTSADVMVLSDDRLTVLGRPWVTVAIDVATRCVLGMYIAMDAPSAVSVSLCIEHAVLPKTENTNDPGVWPMYGKPRRILVDNGKDFRSMALQRGCDQHGIELTWRPIRVPHYGAHIERLIGTLMKIAHLLPGTTFSNTRERGDYNSGAHACMTLGEFKEWMTQKVCRFYHQRRHRTIGLAPVVAWERGLTDAARNFVPPALIARPLDFRMDFLPFEMRMVRRTGIELHASRYWHDGLASMLNADTSALVHYDPRDLRQVWIRRPDGVLITAPVIGGRAAGVPNASPLDEARQAWLDVEVDRGFETTDTIEIEAHRATRRAKHGARAKKPPARTPCLDLAHIGQLLAPPNRAAIHIEEWD